MAGVVGWPSSAAASCSCSPCSGWHRPTRSACCWLLSSPSTRRPGAFVSLTQAEIMDAWPDRQARLMARWDLAGSAGALAGPLLLTAVLRGRRRLAGRVPGAGRDRGGSPGWRVPAAGAGAVGRGRGGGRRGRPRRGRGTSCPGPERARETVAVLRTWANAALAAADRGGQPAGGRVHRVPRAVPGGRGAPVARGRGAGHRDQARRRAGRGRRADSDPGTGQGPHRAAGQRRGGRAALPGLPARPGDGAQAGGAGGAERGHRDVVPDSPGPAVRQPARAEFGGGDAEQRSGAGRRPGAARGGAGGARARD